MKEYVTPELHVINLTAQDVVTASNDVEYNVTEWLNFNGGFEQ